jgi:hypothetical protein
MEVFPGNLFTSVQSQLSDLMGLKDGRLIENDEEDEGKYHLNL